MRKARRWSFLRRAYWALGLAWRMWNKGRPLDPDSDDYDPRADYPLGLALETAWGVANELYG